MSSDLKVFDVTFVNAFELVGLFDDGVMDMVTDAFADVSHGDNPRGFTLVTREQFYGAIADACDADRADGWPTMGKDAWNRLLAAVERLEVDYVDLESEKV